MNSGAVASQLNENGLLCPYTIICSSQCTFSSYVVWRKSAIFKGFFRSCSFHVETGLKCSKIMKYNITTQQEIVLLYNRIDADNIICIIDKLNNIGKLSTRMT
jgi:hypothetical protein